VLGASNVTLGLSAVLSTARAAWGQDVEVLAALGYGRSYGSPSTIAFRNLPGILQSGLWQDLAALPAAPTHGLITDIGNDILYGSSPEQILGWVEEAAERLLVFTPDVAITDLPVESIRRLTPSTFLFFRTLFFPPCRLSRNDVLTRVYAVNEGVVRLAERRGLRLTPLRREWYHFDPIHLRPKAWPVAWRQILLCENGQDIRADFSPLELARLHTLPPHRRSLFGFEQTARQTGRPLSRGGRLWLY
jgi:hypothetical protein